MWGAFPDRGGQVASLGQLAAENRCGSRQWTRVVFFCNPANQNHRVAGLRRQRRFVPAGRSPESGRQKKLANVGPSGSLRFIALTVRVWRPARCPNENPDRTKVRRTTWIVVLNFFDETT